jgi:hypothetical protein
MGNYVTLYGWVAKVAIIALILAVSYLIALVSRRYPSFSNSKLFKYTITTILYIVGMVAVILILL